MLFVLCFMLATAIICQLRLKYIYTMEEVGNGLRAPPVTFLEDVPKGLRGLLVVQVLVVLGLWGVKLNFLLFFYRIFCSASHIYRRIWWAVFVITVICLALMLGLSNYKIYKCVAGDVDIIFTECTKPSYIRWLWIQVQTTSAIDAVNDVLIRLSLRKKIYLSLMFMVSLFTVAMAIIRGTISYGRIASDFTKSQNISWVWFWLQMELFVLSFRTLFTRTRKEKPTYNPVLDPDRPHTFGRTWLVGKKKKSRNIYDSLVDTCIELEGMSDVHPSVSQDSNQTHVLAQLEGKTQADASSAHSTHERLNGNYPNETGWADRWIADSQAELVQNVRHAHIRPGP
ncbi:hypothetical protein F4820DRAFT_459242 [Hypoxylon rubiginosum]|uniref:Uncharacterized protein n=1 Tax=Hypoxylon rubiginosum TaxID=110542 RepID=A0ACB9YY99_9PEZI|nr:hypothetical protein F4820DRAFT_459242 [Hypoxylon rubiginosum]